MLGFVCEASICDKVFIQFVVQFLNPSTPHSVVPAGVLTALLAGELLMVDIN